MDAAMEAVIGLEVHVRLKTKTKAFCSCPNEYGAEPNQHICPVCAGLPGALPVLNEQVVVLALRAAKALGCHVPESFAFCRKNYFYPDLPKGYQITQLAHPIASKGRLRFEVVDQAGAVTLHESEVTRIQIEEDAGKKKNTSSGSSLVDLNRAGCPLIEIVGAPDLGSSGAAVAYLKELRSWLMALGITDANMEEGSFRCDVNVSIRPAGQNRLGPRVEIKNLNSFRFIQHAIEYEIERQRGAPGMVRRQTRGWDEREGASYVMRDKEQLHDYRYFPEPDLPAFAVTPHLVALAEQDLVPQPMEKRRAWKERFGLSAETARVLSAHPAVATFFDDAAAMSTHPVAVANVLKTQVLAETFAAGAVATFSVQPEQVAGLVDLVESGQISGSQAKDLLSRLRGTERSASELVDELGIRQISDQRLLEEACAQVLRDHAEMVLRYRAGKTGLLGFFVAQVMRNTKGSANPRKTSEMLVKMLAEQ